MKILTLNLWKSYEWKKRKQIVINFLKEQDADFVFLQEVVSDERLKDEWSDQVAELNMKLAYRYAKFEKLVKMTRWHKDPIDWVMWSGFGILSKYMIKRSEVVILPSVEKDKKFGFMHLVIKTLEGEINLINVHFENTNVGAKEHLRKTLEWCKIRGIKPIIAGDFNIKLIKNLKELAGEEFTISYVLKQYKSFVPTKFSHDKVPLVLDYILAHKGKFVMSDVKCVKTNISDHLPVVAEIKIK